LNELFGSEDSSAPFTRGHRKYVLEYQDGEPAFRLAEIPSKPTLPRDEIGVALDEVMAELCGPDPDGNEIVPQKLAKLFPGPLKSLGMQLGRLFSRQDLGLL
jgi:hypothetical protein